MTCFGDLAADLSQTTSTKRMEEAVLGTTWVLQSVWSLRANFSDVTVVISV